MSKVMAILVMCESDDLGGIVSDFFKQFSNGNGKPEIKADYVKFLVVGEQTEISETAKEVLENVKRKTIKDKIVDYIQENDFAVISDLVKANIVTHQSVYGALNRMIADGVIVRTGEYGSYRYELANKEEESE